MSPRDWASVAVLLLGYLGFLAVLYWFASLLMGVWP